MKQNSPYHYRGFFFREVVMLFSLFATDTIASEKSDIQINEQEMVDIVYLHKLSAVRQKLIAWADAWNRADVETFIGYYVPEYPLDKNAFTRKKWQTQRRQRIKPERLIKVDLLVRELSLSEQNNHVIVVFEQDYSSIDYSDKVIKKMVWEMIDGDWYIRQEQVLETIRKGF